MQSAIQHAMFYYSDNNCIHKLFSVVARTCLLFLTLLYYCFANTNICKWSCRYYVLRAKHFQALLFFFFFLFYLSQSSLPTTTVTQFSRLRFSHLSDRSSHTWLPLFRLGLKATKTVQEKKNYGVWLRGVVLLLLESKSTQLLLSFDKL